MTLESENVKNRDLIEEMITRIKKGTFNPHVKNGGFSEWDRVERGWVEALEKETSLALWWKWSRAWNSSQWGAMKKEPRWSGGIWEVLEKEYAFREGKMFKSWCWNARQPGKNKDKWMEQWIKPIQIGPGGSDLAVSLMFQHERLKKEEDREDFKILNPEDQKAWIEVLKEWRDWISKNATKDRWVEGRRHALLAYQGPILKQGSVEILDDHGWWEMPQETTPEEKLRWLRIKAKLGYASTKGGDSIGRGGAYKMEGSILLEPRQWIETVQKRHNENNNKPNASAIETLYWNRSVLDKRNEGGATMLTYRMEHRVWAEDPSDSLWIASWVEDWRPEIWEKIIKEWPEQWIKEQGIIDIEQWWMARAGSFEKLNQKKGSDEKEWIKSWRVIGGFKWWNKNAQEMQVWLNIMKRWGEVNHNEMLNKAIETLSNQLKRWNELQECLEDQDKKVEKDKGQGEIQRIGEALRIKRELAINQWSRAAVVGALKEIKQALEGQRIKMEYEEESWEWEYLSQVQGGGWGIKRTVISKDQSEWLIALGRVWNQVSYKWSGFQKEKWGMRAYKKHNEDGLPEESVEISTNLSWEAKNRGGNGRYKDAVIKAFGSEAAFESHFQDSQQALRVRLDWIIENVVGVRYGVERLEELLEIVSRKGNAQEWLEWKTKWIARGMKEDLRETLGKVEHQESVEFHEKALKIKRI